MITARRNQKSEVDDSHETGDSAEAKVTSQSPPLDAKRIGQFFEFNPSEGRITSRIGNSRLFLMRAEVWTAIEEELVSSLSTGGSVVIDRMGYAYGTAFAKSIKSLFSSTSITTLQSLASFAGWGTFTAEYDEKKNSWIRVTGKECVFSYRKDGAVQKDNCFFLSGVFRGMAEELYGRKYMVLQNKCYHFGVHSCEIALQEVFTPSKLSGIGRDR